MPQSARPRVLVVDDESDIRGLIGSVLDASAWSHADARNGEEALERLSAEEYDAVVLDLMMPGTDGLAVLGTLQAARPELLSRIIVLTGGTDELVGRIDQHVFRVLRKPFSPRELVQAVRECLAGEEAAALPPLPEPVEGPATPPPGARAHLRLGHEGGFVVDFPDLERWWVDGGVEPFRTEARGLKETLRHALGPGESGDVAAGVPIEQAAESIREMLLDLERLGLASRLPSR